MRQLQLFTSAEVAMMHDRIKSRDYSAARDEFRRMDQQQCDRGRRRGHIDHLRRVRGCTYAEAAAAGDGVRRESPPGIPARPPSVRCPKASI
ncbi:hypothetical protein JCM9534A_55410 [Catenuloplanes indicus JCM 9534]